MSQVPPNFTPQNSFADLAALPITSSGLPGAQLDSEFVRVQSSINQTISRLSELQRDDGALKNGVVSMASLGSDILVLVASLGATPKTWASGASFVVGDLVSNPYVVNAITVTGASSLDGVYLPTGIIGGKMGFGVGAKTLTWDSGSWKMATFGSLYRSYYDTAYPHQSSLWYDLTTLVPGVDLTATTSFVAGTYYCIAPHTASGTFAADINNWALIAAKPEAGDLIVNSFTGNGAQTVFVLSVAPIEEVNTQVFVNGLYQPKSAYSLAGTSLTFAVAPANASAIEVVSGIPAQQSVLTPSDYSVTTIKLAADAVTEEKLADGAVSADKLVTGAVGTAKIADAAITEAKIAAGSITAEKLSVGCVLPGSMAPNSVLNSAIADNQITEPKIAGGSITSFKLASGSIELQGGSTNPTTANGIVTKGFLERAGSVFGSMLGVSSVTTGSIANATVTGAKLSKSGSIPCQTQWAKRESALTIPSASWEDITGLSVTITRVNLTGRIRVQAAIACSATGVDPIAFRVLRGGTVVGSGNASGSRTEIAAAGGTNISGNSISSVVIDFVDDTSALSGETYTYKIQARVSTGTGYINRSVSDPNTSAGLVAQSSMTLTELTG